MISSAPATEASAVMLTVLSVLTAGTLLLLFDINISATDTPIQTTAAAVTTGITGNLCLLSACPTGFLDGVSIGANTTSSFSVLLSAKTAVSSVFASAVSFVSSAFVSAVSSVFASEVSFVSSAFVSAVSSVFASVTFSFSSAIDKTSVSVSKKIPFYPIIIQQNIPKSKAYSP